MPKKIEAPVPPVERRAYTLTQFRAAGGPCRSTAYQLIQAGKLRCVKLGRRTLIPTVEIERFFADLPAVQP